jgi:hypothetical protein
MPAAKHLLADHQTLFRKKLGKKAFSMFAQENQKALFLATPRPKKSLIKTLVKIYKFTN